MRISGYGFLLIFLLIAGSCSGQRGMSSAQREASGDTVMIADQKKNFTLSEADPQLQINIPVSELMEVSGAHYFLTLRNVSLEAAPDGVYEIYCSRELVSAEGLSDSVPGFVTVLDTYTLGSSPGKRDVRLDISRVAPELFREMEHTAFWLTIRFRGNSLPGGGESLQTGRLSMDGVGVYMLR